ncbi:MAG TPA: flotillin-like FloA family protein, partial [Planctomycetota bacterium]|nr:flotillin-like FloA family protein [Planctomycetota bacterium]
MNPSLLLLLPSPVLLQVGRRTVEGRGFPLLEIGIGVLILLAFILLVVFLRYANLWVQSLFTHAGIGLFEMVGMSFRKVNPATILRAKIMAVQAGL